VKILLVGSVNRFNAEHFYTKYLRRLGHEVFVLDQYEGISRKFLFRLLVTRTKVMRILVDSQKINKSLPSAVRKIDPDLILVFKGEVISDTVLKKLSQSHRLALVYPDTYRFPAILRGRLQYFDVVFTAANKHEFYYKLGAKRVVTLPWACDPELHRRLQEVTKIYPISFIGTFYLERYLLLKQLREFKEKIHIFGNHWVIKPAQVFPAVYGEEYVKVVNQSVINLNIHHPKDVEADAPNMRVFEITGCGGLLFTEEMPSINKYFSTNEVVSFSDVIELKEKIKYYLENNSEMEEIRERAILRSYKEHSYLVRAKNLVENI